MAYSAFFFVSISYDKYLLYNTFIYQFPFVSSSKF